MRRPEVQPPGISQKIAIVGSPGAGKSTFALRLAEKTGLPLYHLDVLYFAPGWKRRHEKSAWPGVVKKLTEEPRWIIDGNYLATMDLRMDAADLVIYLDVGPLRALSRIVKRWSMFRGGSRPSVAPDCRERLHWSIVRSIVRHPLVDRPKILQAMHLGKAQVTILRNSKEVEKFLNTLPPFDFPRPQQ